MAARGGHSWQIFLQVLLLAAFFKLSYTAQRCGGGSKKLQYVWGDALTDPPGCTGPDGRAYPAKEIQKYVTGLKKQGRQSRNLFTDSPGSRDPEVTRKELLRIHELGRNVNLASLDNLGSRTKRSANLTKAGGCVVGGAPPRLCRSSYNTTAPLYGVSLTSGQPVTIVQKFPDLLQQVIYETCDTSECDVLHGECIQTYVPYLFLVIPLGPVTLTGQDYVLVESGCTCRPKYATPGSDPNPSDVIPNFS